MTDPALQSDNDALFAAAQVSPWTLREKAGRTLWMLVQATLFRWSFHNWYSWRAFLLRLFGGKVGGHVHIRSTARIEIPWNLRIGDYSSIGDFAVVYCLGPVSIGRRATVSQYAHLCAGTHDMTDSRFPLLKTPITIGEGCFIGIDAYIAPEVVLGDRCRVWPRASVYKSFPAGTNLRGNPAKPFEPDA